LIIAGGAGIAGNTHIAGDLNVDSGTFRVDATNNRVGVNVVPATGVSLDVSGTIRSTPNPADLNYSADIIASYDSGHPFQINVKNNGTSAEFIGVYALGGGGGEHVRFPTGNVEITTTTSSTTTTTGALIVAGGVGVQGNIHVGANIVASSGSITDSAGHLRRVPQNSQGSGYTLVVGDLGKHISISTGGVTVPANIFSAGDVVTIYNNSASTQTITQGTSLTLRLAGTATTGNRSLALRGVSTILFISATEAVINGGGLT
jgi:hypothetical protein